MDGLAPLQPLEGPPMGGLGPTGAVSGTNPLGGFGKSGTMQGLDGNPDDPFNTASLAPPLILRCKIVLLGDSTVGKTSLANVFQGGAQYFSKNYNMTIGMELVQKSVPIPDTNVNVEFYVADCG